MKQSPSLRSEIRRVDDAAMASSKPISSRIIWGSLSRDVPEESFQSLLSSMCGSHQILKVRAPDGTFDRGGYCYEPGPVQVPDGKRQEAISRSMGNMAHKRLMDARKAAREWARQGRRAA